MSPAVSKGFLRNALLPSAAFARRDRRGAAHGRGCGTDALAWPCPAGPGSQTWARPGAIRKGRLLPSIAWSTCGHHGRAGPLWLGHCPPVPYAYRAPRPCSGRWFCHAVFPQLCPTPQVKHSFTAAFPSVAKHYPCSYTAGAGSSGRKLTG